MGHPNYVEPQFCPQKKEKKPDNTQTAFKSNPYYALKEGNLWGHSADKAP